MAPSRSTVIAVGDPAISFSLWEIRIEVMPCALNSSSRSSSASLSVSFRLAVGSSRISSFTSLDSALAISTSCCLPTPMSVTSVVGALAQARPCAAARAVRAKVSSQSMTPRRADLVAEEDVLGDRQQRHQRQLLVDDDDAELLAVGDVAEAPRLALEEDLALVGAVRDRRRTAPSSASTCRRRSRRPAAWISPGCTVRLTLSSALHAREGLGDAAHLEDRLHSRPPRDAGGPGGPPRGRISW